MKKQPEVRDLRRSVSGCGKTLAVLGASGGPLEVQPGISLVRGVWEGKPAVAVVADPGSPVPREAYERDLKYLHEISFDLSLCQSVDEICRDAVRLGRDRLDFDRLSIWLVDRNDPHFKVGTWGIDEEGKLRDEHNARHPIDGKGGVPGSFYKGKVPLYLGSDEVCYDHEGREVGRGSKLIAPLWDGRAFMGEFSVDNLISHREFGPEKKEAFVIFSRVVANLISLKRAEAELKYLASTDSLTGTVNRRTTLIILEKHIAQCRRTGSPLAICLADLDGLKLVNDAYGHAAGDEYIRCASSALVGAVRGSDTVGRIGGDEFLIVFPDCRGNVVATIMERVNAELASGAKPGSYLPRLSWGIASLGEVSEGAHAEAELQRCIDILLERADQRMYDDKRSKGAARPKATGEPELAF
jgi:diguanylate cyclase (GGDEF)-like protein